MTFLTSILLASVAQFGTSGGHAEAELYTRIDEGSETVRAAIVIEIDPGWHLYHDDLGPPDAVGQATTLELGGEGITWSKARFPEPHRSEQLGIGKDGRDTWIWTHEDTIVLYAIGGLTEGVDPGAIDAELRGLTCEDEGQCVLYRETVPSSGAGKDALFADFPGDLEVPAPQGVIEGWDGQQVGKAKAKLFVREQDGVAQAAIVVNIDYGWHLYHEELGPDDAVGKPTVVQLGGTGIEWSPVVFPEPHRYEQPGIGKGGADTWIWGHEGKVVLFAEGQLEEGDDLEASIALVEGLTCEDSGQCVLYRAAIDWAGEGDEKVFEEFPQDLAALAGGAGSITDVGRERGQPTEPTGTGRIAAAAEFPEFAPQVDAVERGLVMWLLLAFLAGMILNVMPCVLPVISIKILSFVQQAGESRSRMLALGTSFAAGIMVVFIALAIFAIAAGAKWGEQFQSEGFVIAMVGIVFAFSLSLFGVFELGVPKAVGGMAAGPPREGLGDAFTKGMIATLLATPCSGPFLGSTLTWAFAQPASVVFLIFLSLGLGMAFPYIVLTANPGLLKFLPKPGAWMETFKQAMGFVLLLTVLYLLTLLPADQLLFVAAFLIFVALGCWWWGRFATFDQTVVRRFGTLAVALMLCGGGYFLSFHSFKGLYESEGELAWVPFDYDLFIECLDDGTNVMVDFTADWCPNCKLNEAVVYESDEMVEKFGAKGVVCMKADMTHSSEYTDMLGELRDALGASSIPFLAIFPGDDPYRPFTLFDIVTKGELGPILDGLPDTRRNDLFARLGTR